VKTNAINHEVLQITNTYAYNQTSIKQTNHT